MPFARHWLEDGASDACARAAAITLVAQLVEFGGGAQHAAGLLGPIRAVLFDEDEDEEEDGSGEGDDELREAALYAIGVIVEHAAQAMPPAGVTAVATKLVTILQAPRARAASSLALSCRGHHTGSGQAPVTCLYSWYSTQYARGRGPAGGGGGEIAEGGGRARGASNTEYILVYDYSI